LWEDFVELHRPAQSLDDLMTMKRDRMIEILRAERPFFGGIRELIQDLAGTHTLGLASGSERLIVEEVLTLGELHPFFRSVITGSEVLDGKPEPEIFHRSADALGTPASACLVIEDSRPGVTAALAAGMQVVAVTHTHSAEELADATLVVPDVAALRAAVFRG
jgi:HAD superfamily hydrolase (TIGR01509 family)